MLAMRNTYECQTENMKVRDSFEVLRIAGKLILQWIQKETGVLGSSG
jgi:hypothetical protein